MNQLEQFRQIEAFLFDVDGVLSPNQVLVTEEGYLLRQMSVRDGYAIRQAIMAGYKVGIITGGRSEGVRLRLQGLGVEDVYLGAQEKLAPYEHFIDKYGLDEAKVLYMGDDLPDYPVMRRAGFPVCPQDAAPEIIELALYISHLNGGDGCVRDVIEKVLRLAGRWQVG
jgi:3-deoxy-D-manno-octulosonate 8-phosphate phosphatase (KDO 8-P phosphatase)